MQFQRAEGRRAVVFDLDGTVVDSLPDLASAVNRMLGELGRRSLAQDEVRPMVGDGAAMLVRRALAATGEAPEAGVEAGVRRFLEIYEGSVADATRPWPGVPEVLERLKAGGLRLGLCTNKPQEATERLLRELGLHHLFDAILGGDAVAFRKPDPRHLLATLERLGAAPEAAVMVGDSPNDVAAARGAGVPVVAVSFGYTRIPPAELGADALIDAFEALPEALSALLDRPARRAL